MRHTFGWSLPPGVTQRHIDEAAGGYDEPPEPCPICGDPECRDPHEQDGPAPAPEPDDDWQPEIIRAKWKIDGAATLSQAAAMLRKFADHLVKIEAEGWQLTQPVADDYGFIEQEDK
jgi:hypothetical protein